MRNRSAKAAIWTPGGTLCAAALENALKPVHPATAPVAASEDDDSRTQVSVSTSEVTSAASSSRPASAVHMTRANATVAWQSYNNRMGPLVPDSTESEAAAALVSTARAQFSNKVKESRRINSKSALTAGRRNPMHGGGLPVDTKTDQKAVQDKREISHVADGHSLNGMLYR